MTPGLYRIGISTIALVTNDGKHVATTIPKDDIVELADTPMPGDALIHVKWNGQTVEMFTQDLLERGQEVQDLRGKSH